MLMLCSSLQQAWLCRRKTFLRRTTSRSTAPHACNQEFGAWAPSSRSARGLRARCCEFWKRSGRALQEDGTRDESTCRGVRRILALVVRAVGRGTGRELAPHHACGGFLSHAFARGLRDRLLPAGVRWLRRLVHLSASRRGCRSGRRIRLCFGRQRKRQRHRCHSNHQHHPHDHLQRSRGGGSLR